MNSRSVMMIALVAVVVFFFFSVIGFHSELNESHQRLLETEKVLEKIKIDLGNAEEELERVVKEKEAMLSFFVLTLPREREGKILIRKNDLVWLLNCCQATIDAGRVTPWKEVK